MIRPPYGWKETVAMVGRRFGPTPPLRNGPLEGRVDLDGEPPDFWVGFVGDLGPNLGREIELSEGVRAFFSDCAHMVANLEGVLTERPWRPYRHPLRMEDLGVLLERIQPLDRWCLSLANNHALDYGVGALEQSAKRCEEHGIEWIGLAERSRTALRPGLTVTAWTRWLNAKASRRVAREDPGSPGTSGVHVAYPHWGYEHERVPREAQRKEIPEDYDAVVGHHSHLPQPVEVLEGNRVAAWSLGNFLTGKLLRKLGEGIALKLGIAGSDREEFRIAALAYRHLRIVRPYHRSVCRIQWYR